MTATHTYAVVEVSESAYEEIKAILVRTGYADADVKTLDMHGLALRVRPEKRGWRVDPFRDTFAISCDGTIYAYHPDVTVAFELCRRLNGG